MDKAYNVNFESISSLPNPNGPLSEKIYSKAIELANAEVEKISHLSKEQASEKTRSPRPNKYLILSPAQRFEVGKRAAEHGVTASAQGDYGEATEKSLQIGNEKSQ